MRQALVPILMVAAAASAAPAQMPNPGIARQQAAIARLDQLDGAWRGAATVYRQGAAPLALVHTERVGSALDGTVKLIEGRSYDQAGKDAGFNALGIISYSDGGGGYEFRSYAQGHVQTSPMLVTADGYEWSLAVGGGITVRYRATVKGGSWKEEGWAERGGQRLGKVFEMSLTRIGGTNWPGGTPVGAQ